MKQEEPFFKNCGPFLNFLMLYTLLEFEHWMIRETQFLGCEEPVNLKQSKSNFHYLRQMRKICWFLSSEMAK